jgi:hypothetical protein
MSAAHKAAGHNRKDRAVRRIINKALVGVGVLGVATGIVLASAVPAAAEPTAAAATARPGILTVCANGTYNARVVVKGRDGQGNNGLQNALTSPVAAPNTCADVGISGTLGQGDVNVFVEGDFGNGFQDIGVGTFNNLSAGRSPPHSATGSFRPRQILRWPTDRRPRSRERDLKA